MQAHLGQGTTEGKSALRGMQELLYLEGEYRVCNQVRTHENLTRFVPRVLTRLGA